MYNILLFITTCVSLIHCNVNLTTDSDVTTVFPEDYTTTQASSVVSNVDSIETDGEEIKKSDYLSHLDNVISVMKDQTWSDDEGRCVDETILMMESVMNATFWAVWKWDSMTSNPLSVLYGTSYQLGNFDQCLAGPWTSSQSLLLSQYCLVDVTFDVKTVRSPAQHIFKPVDPYSPAKNFIKTRFRHSRPVDLVTFGVCLPASCSPQAVEKVAATLVSSSSLSILDLHMTVRLQEKCQNGVRKEFDAAFYAYITIAVLLLVTAAVCTHAARHNLTRSTGARIIRAFSLESNAKNMMVMKSEGLDILYGIRFLTICLIVLGHQTGVYNGGGPTINGRTFDEDAMSGWGLVFLHFDIFVDTFYTMSALLTVSNLLSMKKFANPFVIILKRYVRLVVALAVVVFYIIAVLEHTGSGPLWPQAVQHEEGPCRRNWWLTLLMINNYVRGDDICIVISWYIPTDFQCFLVTVALWCIYRRSKRLAITLANICGVASILTVGILTYINDLAPIQILTYEFLIHQRENKEFNLVYIKAHTRFAAYWVGLMAGYILTKSLKEENRKRWPMKWSILGAFLGMGLMAAVMVTGAHLVSREISPAASAIYAAINRPAWAMGLVMLICCCSLGTVPLISSFLSWYPWVPLSRLSYGLYLTHIFIVLRNVFISRQPQYMDQTHSLVEASGVIVWGSIAALVMWLLVEAPVINLLNICISPKASSLSSSEKDDSDCKRTTQDSNGHMKDKLPAAIQISKV